MGAFDVGLGSAFILLAIYAGGMVVKSWRFDIHATFPPFGASLSISGGSKINVC